jgi:hypothetical protein
MLTISPALGTPGETEIFCGEIVRSGSSDPGAITGIEINNCPTINPLSTILTTAKSDNIFLIVSPTLLIYYDIFLCSQDFYKKEGS